MPPTSYLETVESVRPGRVTRHGKMPPLVTSFYQPFQVFENKCTLGGARMRSEFDPPLRE